MDSHKLQPDIQGGLFMSDKVIVTIARQYGSGGHAVGKLVAEKFGLAYHDKSLIEKFLNLVANFI